MLKIQQLSLHFADRPLFNDISIFIGDKDRVGLTGRNGAGKSTLLKILAGLQKPDSGQINKPKDLTIAYLPQEMQHNENATIKEEAGHAFDLIKKLENRIEEINHQLVTRTDYESEIYSNLLVELHEANEYFQLHGGYNQQESIEKVLMGLGFEQTDFSRKMSEFSGGWKMRVELAKILLQKPDLLLLDEPTNHLDIDSIEWLEEFLSTNSGAIILISHDKTFLDNITNRTIEISAGRIYDYKAAYSKYLVLRTVEREQQEQASKNQEKYIEQTELLINKFRAKKSKASFAQSLMKKLDKLEIIDVDKEDKSSIKFRFQPSASSGKVVLEGKNLSKKYENKEVFEDIDILIGKKEKIALVGKNGAGKSTLLKILVGETSFEGEYNLGHNVNLGYYGQNQTDLLDPKKTIFETIDDIAEGDIRKNIMALLGSFLFKGDDVLKKVRVLSGGEKARLAMCKLLLQPYNFLVLDEPTNHLDMKSKEILKEALLQYDGTLLVVSHDRDFLHQLTDRIYELKNGHISQKHTDIKEFLEEKKQLSIASYENTNVKKSPPKAEKVEKTAFENNQIEKDKKRIIQNIEKFEKEIEKLEREIESKSILLTQLDYTDKISADKHIKEFEEFKNKLDTSMKNWEIAVQELETSN
jgi:ATP-binding cassette, subfamily F, member 3